MPSRRAAPTLVLLGIEGGATRTVAILASEERALRFETGPGNVRLLSDRQLGRLFSGIAARFRFLQPKALGIGMAGARNESDRARILKAAARQWPGLPCAVGSDLDTALAAATPVRPGPAGARPRVLVLSGTGSCCYGIGLDGTTAKVGGWGHQLGDVGSGYELGWKGLRAVIRRFDRVRIWSRLGHRILRSLQLNEPEALVDWTRGARKEEVAALALDVFAAGKERDPDAIRILREAAENLAADASLCADRLVGKAVPVEFVLAGGVLVRQPQFARTVARCIRGLRPNATVRPLPREGAWGAVKMAQAALPHPQASARSLFLPAPGRSSGSKRGAPSVDRLAPTEQRNPRSRHLDRLPVRAAIRLMLSEESRVPAALVAEGGRIEKVIKWVSASLRRGGRLFYVGAGTSGRLGVLDASECPPTFRTSPEQVQGIMAGGQRALWQAVEGAEDRSEEGAAAVRFRGVKRGDIVVGIAASGRTPFVWGALSQAKKFGARTVLLCFNPGLSLTRGERPHLVIAPDIGPEVLTGSTRLKAGTATKLFLNILSTLSMVRLGKVVGNLMVDLNPSNMKLRERAVRIVQALTGVKEDAARKALERNRWVVKRAIRDVSRQAARVGSRRR